MDSDNLVICFLGLIFFKLVESGITCFVNLVNKILGLPNFYKKVHSLLLALSNRKIFQALMVTICVLPSLLTLLIEPQQLPLLVKILGFGMWQVFISGFLMFTIMIFPLAYLCKYSTAIKLAKYTLILNIFIFLVYVLNLFAYNDAGTIEIINQFRLSIISALSPFSFLYGPIAVIHCALIFAYFGLFATGKFDEMLSARADILDKTKNYLIIDKKTYSIIAIVIIIVLLFGVTLAIDLQLLLFKILPDLFG